MQEATVPPICMYAFTRAGLAALPIDMLGRHLYRLADLTIIIDRSRDLLATTRPPLVVKI